MWIWKPSGNFASNYELYPFKHNVNGQIEEMTKGNEGTILLPAYNRCEMQKARTLLMNITSIEQSAVMLGIIQWNVVLIICIDHK